MARKKKHEEHVNHERWLVSYADFITLLFAFFVVMYSISSVNEGKYRVLSDAIVAAFQSPSKSMQPIQVGKEAKSPESKNLKARPIPALLAVPHMPLPDVSKDGAKGTGKAMKRMAEKIKKAMAWLIEDDLIAVRQDESWLEIEIKSNILFVGGSAKLQAPSVPILVEIARILADFPHPIRVEGFTDNTPIKTPIFPSNWELSAGRSAAVVHLFTKNSIDPLRLSAVGYGEFRPIADNATSEGRQKNRRVVLVVLKDEDAQRLREASQNMNPLTVDVPTSESLIQFREAPIPDAPIQDEKNEPATKALDVEIRQDVAIPKPDEPIDVMSREVTEVGRFPIIAPPIKLTPPMVIKIPKITDAYLSRTTVTPKKGK